LTSEEYLSPSSKFPKYKKGGGSIGHTIEAGSFTRDIFIRINFGLFFDVLLFLWKPASDSSEPEFVNFSMRPGIDSQHGGPE
jgi:hypothetical protein